MKFKMKKKVHYSVLIVEDSKLINEGIAKELRLDGHTVTQAYTLREGLDTISHNEYDYLLLDLILPDGEGEMLLPYTRNMGIRTIVMTTDRDSLRRDRLFGFGIIDYITKERYFNDVIQTIRNTIAMVESNDSYTVLVVDDSNFIRNHLELLFSSRGLNVLTAINGLDALKILEKYTIDVLLTDLEMPDMNGFELMSKLRRNIRYESLPIIVLTGSNDSQLIAKVIKHGVKDVIKKPYIIEELLLKIDNILETIKKQRHIDEEQVQFKSYHDGIDSSTLYMRIKTDFGISYMNAKMQQNLFLEGEEVNRSRTLAYLLQDTQLALLRKILMECKGGNVYENILIFPRENHSPLYVSATISPIFDSKGFLKEMILIGHDVTVLQQNEQQLQMEVKKQLSLNLKQQQVMFNQAKMAAMGEMIGNISHQWRQPLNALGLIIQDAEDAYEFGEVDRNYMSKMVKNAMQKIIFMSNTIDDFRNFFSTNKVKEHFDVVAGIHQMGEIMALSLDRSAIVLEFPKNETPITIYGYKNELQQVVLNLLNNAKDAIIDHPSLEGKKQWIRITVEENEKEIQLNIADSGGGVSLEIMDRIFEPYYTTKEEGKGTGVGLYMSKMIIEENMKGSLGVMNSLDGAVFTITLPKENR